MSGIKIVVDSTLDIPKEIADNLNIAIIPLYINFSNNVFKDGIDITSSEFYEKLENAIELPKTSQPSVGDFCDLYKNLLKNYKEIISIHISAGLSGTMNSALKAKEIIGKNVHIVDSGFLSLGGALQAIEAAKDVAKGYSLESVLENIEKIRKNTKMFFTLDTLKYLEKGGRIGKASALLGNILNIKPVLKVHEGVFHPVSKVRSKKQAILKLVDLVESNVNNKKINSIMIGHGNAKDEAYSLKGIIEEKMNVKIDTITKVGPVVGVHTGPGTLGIAFC